MAIRDWRVDGFRRMTHGAFVALAAKRLAPCANIVLASFHPIVAREPETRDSAYEFVRNADDALIVHLRYERTAELLLDSVRHRFDWMLKLTASNRRRLRQTVFPGISDRFPGTLVRLGEKLRPGR